PTSSRNSAPAAASSKRPGFWRSAPVNAPRSWPKSSDSSNASGRAAQLTGQEGTVGPAARGVNRARDGLLARAALAGDHHGGLGRGPFGGECQTLAQRPRAADDPIEAVSLAHRFAERLQALLETLRALLGEGQPPLLVGQPLMLERHDDAGRDVPGDLHIGGVEPVRAALAEVQRATDHAARGQRHAEGAAPAAIEHEAITG